MKRHDLAPMWRWALAALLVLILITQVVEWALLLRLNEDVARLTDDRARKATLPCAALPTRFVLESPECAQKLLDAMNVSNVRIVSRATDPLSQAERQVHAEHSQDD
ncbi:MAG: hypothetical protein KJ749_02925 [Planctomycetes bacterium]|nr:hypothetical protein [Planctomycetota bacterium]